MLDTCAVGAPVPHREVDALAPPLHAPLREFGDTRSCAPEGVIHEVMLRRAREPRIGANSAGTVLPCVT